MSVWVVGVGGYFRKVGGQRTFRRGGKAPDMHAGDANGGSENFEI
jgi:hypothetical protein